MLAQPQDAGYKTQLGQKRRIVDGRSKNMAQRWPRSTIRRHLTKREQTKVRWLPV